MAAGAAGLFLDPFGPPLPPLPEPNAYPELVEAGAAIRHRKSDDPNDPDTLLAWFESRRDIEGRARRALEHESGVPLLGDVDAIVNRSVQAIGPLRDLGRYFLTKAKLAREEGRTDDALAAILDALGLSGKAGRGGLIIDQEVGIAIESTAMEALGELAEALDDAQSARAMKAIQALEERREGPDTVCRRERALYRSRGELPIRLMARMTPGRFNMMCKPAEDAFRRFHDRSSARARLLLLELALRRYRRGQGAEAARLEDLVPEYLPTVPADPFGKGPPVYRQVGGGHMLYSVGPDGTDDGGEPVPIKGMTAGSRRDIPVPGLGPRPGP
mgnify:CR=1 FL=1